MKLPFRRQTGLAPRPAAPDRQRTRITPEGLALTFTLASRGARAGALALDLAMIVALLIATGVGLTLLAHGLDIPFSGDLDPRTRVLQVLFVVWMAVLFLSRQAWFVFFELGPRGATPGKRLVGLRVAARGRGEAAGRLTTEAVIARNLVRDIELFLPIAFFARAVADQGDVGLAGWGGLAWVGTFLAVPFLNRDGLRCGDVIAGTWVVEAPRRKLERAMVAEGEAAAAQTGPERFTEAELAVYGEHELKVLEGVLRANHAESLRQVAETIAARIGRDAPPVDDRAFLAAFYTQLRARLEGAMRFGKRKADKHSGG